MQFDKQLVDALFWALEKFYEPGIDQVEGSGDKIDQENDALAKQIEKISTIPNTLSNNIVNETETTCEASNKLSNGVSCSVKDTGNKLNEEIQTGKTEQDKVCHSFWYFLEEDEKILQHYSQNNKQSRDRAEQNQK